MPRDRVILIHKRDGTVVEAKGYRAHFNGKFNYMKGLVLTALWLRQRQGRYSGVTFGELVTLSKVNYGSLNASMARWFKWRRHYLLRHGTPCRYKYCLSSYGRWYVEKVIPEDARRRFIDILTKIDKPTGTDKPNHP